MFCTNEKQETALRFLMEGVDFGPLVEPEHTGAFFTKKSHEAFSKGDFNQVPTLIGFNKIEGVYIVANKAPFRQEVRMQI